MLYGGSKEASASVITLNAFGLKPFTCLYYSVSVDMMFIYCNFRVIKLITTTYAIILCCTGWVESMQDNKYVLFLILYSAWTCCADIYPPKNKSKQKGFHGYHPYLLPFLI